jgi:hypothetical protein
MSQTMRSSILVLALLVLPLPALADTIPKATTTDSDAVFKARSAVLAHWRIPRLTDDMTVQAQFTVQADGKLTDPKVSVEGAAGDERNDTRISMERAIQQTQVVGLPVGSIAFTVQAKSGARYPRCFPVKVYVPTRTEDTKEEIYPTSLTGLRQGVIKWNAAVVGYSQEKVGAPFIFVNNPDEANLRIVAYEDHPTYSGYYTEEVSGQIVLHIPVKQSIPSLLGTGYRWGYKEPVTQDTMFHIGRFLGLNISANPSNVLFPGSSLVAAGSRTDASNTKAVVTEFAGNSFEVETQGLGDRTLTNFQLEDAVTLVRERYCQTSPAPVQGEQPPTKASAPQESGV